MGSTRAVVDEAGNVLETFDYYPFGLLMPKRNGGTNTTLEKFTGKERDTEGNLNLDYFGARYYDPALAKWHSVDPLADEYPAWSPYNYVLNNPLALVDPDGRCPEGYEEGDIWNNSRCLGEVVVTASRLPAEESQANVSVPLTGLGFGRSISVGSRLGAAGAAAASLVYLNYLTNQALAQQGTFIPSTHTGTIVLPNTGDRPWWETISDPITTYTPAPRELPAFPGARRVKPKGGRTRWKTPDGLILEWDSLHGEVEVYNKRGKHKGAFDHKTGKQLKNPDPTKKIDP